MPTTVQILDGNDIIEPTDYARQLSLTWEGQSDYLQQNTTYGNSPINRLGWLPVTVTCPCWIGKTVKDFSDAMDKFYATAYKEPFEFIRGELPNRHLEPLTKD